MASSIDAIRESVSEGKGLAAVHGQAAEMIASGADREAIISALEEFRAELRASGDEAAEDLVMDLMDFVIGWCRPDSRL